MAPTPFPYQGLNPFGADLAPQGLFGNLLGALGQPLGGLAGGLLGNPRLGAQFGGLAGQLGALLPFGADPFSALMAARLAQGLAPQAAGAPATTPAAPTVDVGALEAEAMNGFLQEAASGAIRKLFDYLEKNSARFPQLAQFPAVLSQAVEAFKSKNYAQALGIAFQAHRAIVLLRASVADMPPIQS